MSSDIKRLASKTNKSILFIFISFYIYAIIRYHFGKELFEWYHYPFVLNKAFAWTGGTLLVLTLLPNSILNHYSFSKKWLGNTGYSFSMIHIPLNFLLLSPNLFPKFYNGQFINSYGWLCISIGVLSMLLFSIPLIAKWINGTFYNKKFNFGLWGNLVLFFHVFSLGITGWIDPSKWPLSMPPITLIFCAFSLIIFSYRFVFSNRSTQSLH